MTSINVDTLRRKYLASGHIREDALTPSRSAPALPIGAIRFDYVMPRWADYWAEPLYLVQGCECEPDTDWIRP